MPQFQPGQPGHRIDDAKRFRGLKKNGERRVNLTDPAMKRLRAIAFIRERIRGKSMKTIADEYNTSESTVRQSLSYARRAGILVSEGDAILEEMVPLSKSAIVEALKAPDDEVDKLSKAHLGMKIYEGVGLLGNKGKPSGTNSDDDDLMREMHLLRQKAAEIEASTEGLYIEAGSTQRPLLDGAVGPAAGAEAEGLSVEAGSQARADEAGVLPDPFEAAAEAPPAPDVTSDELSRESDDGD